MSIGGVIGLFRGSPQNPIGDDGRMALADHLRELRARLLKVTLFLLVATSSLTIAVGVVLWGAAWMIGFV